MDIKEIRKYSLADAEEVDLPDEETAPEDPDSEDEDSDDSIDGEDEEDPTTEELV